jgi:hypothetical protein
VKKKSENIKNLEEDVKKAFKFMFDEYGIQPNQATIDLVIKTMVDKSHYSNAEELLYGYNDIRYEIKKMIKEALKQKFGG